MLSSRRGPLIISPATQETEECREDGDADATEDVGVVGVVEGVDVRRQEVGGGEGEDVLVAGGVVGVASGAVFETEAALVEFDVVIVVGVVVEGSELIEVDGTMSFIRTKGPDEDAETEAEEEEDAEGDIEAPDILEGACL